jgi:hypothetical protein
MIQLVPSLTTFAYLPAVAESMAVVAAPPIAGTTFAEAETTVNAVVVLIINSLPAKVEGVGRVSVQEAATLLIRNEVVAKTV